MYLNGKLLCEVKDKTFSNTGDLSVRAKFDCWIAIGLVSAYVVTGQPCVGQAPDGAVLVESPVVVASRTTERIGLDGVLDESVWQRAKPTGPLLQRDPKEGIPASEKTEFRVAYTDDALYVGILCHDRMPKQIVATQLNRDASLEADDRVLVILDPFFDHRNGFFFEVNPSGARADGQVSNNQEHRSYDWDGIWYAGARINEDGWTAEIEIPFKTLRFNPNQAVWGLNVERHIKRLNENDRWASPRRDIWITNLAEAGRLEGLAGIRQGHGLDIRPYLSGGDQNGHGRLDTGLDVVKNITPNLNASLTVNTDFAETEVDVRQINLTRFPLFFPEKRSFFLEGAGVFDIAGLGGGSRDILPFFSRRIGLLSSREVPILAGAKAIGRQGDYNIGFLDVHTRDLDDNPQTGQNLLAARVTRNLFRQSWVGAIVTRGNPAGSGPNNLLGADVRLATSEFRGRQNLSLDLYLLRTDDARNGKINYAGGLKIDYPNDLWDIVLNWKQIGENFSPALGFVPRAGIRKTNLGIAFKPRPQRLGIRQFFFELRPEYITNLENRVENWKIFVAPFNLRTESGEHFEWNFTPEYEHLEAPFEISRGIVIPAGSYRWSHHRAEMNTATKRRWVADLSLEWGGFYNGTRRAVSAGLGLKPNTHVAVSLLTERNDIKLKQGTFDTQVFSIRADYNFSPDIAWANLVQYDSESQILGIQSRFRWILKPGNDVFLVFNRGWFHTFDGGYRPSFDIGTAKIQYTLRF